MTLPVAIASENDAFDGAIYERLLAQVLRRPVERWVGEFRFSGCRSVAKLCPAFLAAAAAAGVRHALLAIDNDGGARRRPEHDATHAPVPFDIADDDGCRECWLLQSVPPSYCADGGLLAVVVPVQAIETWLLALRGDLLHPTPEHKSDRRALKTLFFGKPTPSRATQIALALKQLDRPGALDLLRARPSFRRFEQRVSSW